MTLSPLDHEHPLDARQVALARRAVIGIDEGGRLGRLLGLVQDPVRCRVLFALSAVEELCVGDLALTLDVSDDAISYALRLLRTAGLVAFRKEGRVVFYRLADGFPINCSSTACASCSRSPRRKRHDQPAARPSGPHGHT